MTIAELRAKLPEAEVLALDPNCKYLILVSPDQVPKKSVAFLFDDLNRMGIQVVFFWAYPDGLQVFEFTK